MIIVVSDFSPEGSGYQRIMTQLCSRLSIDHDMHILALGLGYKGQEHKWPFAIVPTEPLANVPGMIEQLKKYGAPIEAIVVGLDIPLQNGLLDAMSMSDVPYIGLFPLEAPPLCQPWAMSLLRMDGRLVMSKFGVEELKKAGVSSEYIPIGVDEAVWRAPGPEDRNRLRQGLGIDDDTFMILTVADNQERKNLSKAAEIVSRLSINIEGYLPNGFVAKKSEKKKVTWYLVTRLKSPVGWEVQDLLMRHGIMDRTCSFNRGLPDDKLWALYAAADCFLLTSKAEGLAIPVLEAMASRLPVAGTRCTAIEEHLTDNRGWLIPHDYSYTDPFGNGKRYFISAEQGENVLGGLMAIPEAAKQLRLDQAQAYVQERSWDEAARVMAEMIDRLTTERGTKLSKDEEETHGQAQAAISQLEAEQPVLTNA